MLRLQPHLRVAVRIMETGMGTSREKLVQLRQEVREAAARFREAVRTWPHARRLVQMHVE